MSPRQVATAAMFGGEILARRAGGAIASRSNRMLSSVPTWWAVTMVCLVAFALILGPTVVAQSRTPAPPMPAWYGAEEVPLPDGRVVTCVTYHDRSVSCDWPSAR